MPSRLLHRVRIAWRKRKYRQGARLMQFLAPDVRRDVEIVDASEVEAGFVTARIKTWNVLYSIKGMVPEPAFGRPRRVAIDTLWSWEGEPWGGPVPDDDGD